MMEDNGESLLASPFLTSFRGKRSPLSNYFSISSLIGLVTSSASSSFNRQVEETPPSAGKVHRKQPPGSSFRLLKSWSHKNGSHDSKKEKEKDSSNSSSSASISSSGCDSNSDTMVSSKSVALNQVNLSTFSPPCCSSTINTLKTLSSSTLSKDDLITTDDIKDSIGNHSYSSVPSTSESVSSSTQRNIKLVKFTEVPAYLQFNQYVLEGYRPPNLTAMECIRSLFYFHNETINIFTHVSSILIFGFLMPTLIPWKDIKHPVLAYTAVIGSVSSWVGSSLYHLFMNHRKGEGFYIHLLQFDVTGIWVTQAVGAATTIYTSVVLYDPMVKWSFIVLYSLLSLGSLRDSLVARSAWSRILGFGSLFFLRLVALTMRMMSLKEGQGSPLIHIIMQEAWALIGSFVSATRVPERWFPGRFDFLLNSHNLMHILVVCGAFHMHAAATADLLWLAQVDAEKTSMQRAVEDPHIFITLNNMISNGSSSLVSVVASTTDQILSLLNFSSLEHQEL